MRQRHLPVAPATQPSRLENPSASNRTRFLGAAAVAALGAGVWFCTDPRWGSVLLIASLGAATWCCHRWSRRLACWIALLSLAAAGHYRAETSAPVSLANLPVAPRYRGVVQDDPQLTTSGARMTVKLTGAYRDGSGGWGPAAGQVLLSLHGTPTPPPSLGDAVVFRGPLYPAEGFRNPGTGSYQAYLHRRGISARATARWPGEVFFATPGAGTLPGVRWRRGLATDIAAAAPGQAGAVLRALSLGDRSGLRRETVDAFRLTGTAHVLAISGLHLGILSLLLLPTLRRLLALVPGLALRWPVAPLAKLLTIPALTAYAALAGFQTSTVRALVMASLVLLGTALSRAVAPSGLLAATALTLGLWHPPVLADAGFQLSLAALAGLFWLAPAVMHRVPTGNTDPLRRLLEDHPEPGFAAAGRRQTGRIGRGVLKAVVYSAAAAVVTTPLAVFHFGSGSLAGVVLSPVVIAVLGFFCLPLTLTGLVLHPLLPSLSSGVWNLAGHAAGATVELLTRIAPHAPQVQWQLLRSPEGLFGVSALLAAPVVLCNRRAKTAATLAILGGTLLVLPPIFRHWVMARDPRIHLWVLDVGQGQALALRLPGARWVMVDGGGFPASPFDVGARVVVPALENLGARRLELVVSTHPHPDHLGGLTSVVRWGRPRQLWLAESFAGDPRYSALLEAADEIGSAVRWVDHNGHTEQLGSVPVTARWFPGANENDRSLILSVAGEQGILLPADLERGGLQQLLDSDAIPRCRVLVAPHHGAASSLYPPFLDTADAEAILISAAGRRGLPSPQFIAAARTSGSEVYSTDRMGCVHASLGPGPALAVGPAPR